MRERGADLGTGAIFGPRIIVDDTQQVTDNTWMTYSFSLSQPAKVTLTLDVIQGKGVTAYLLDEAAYEKFADANQSLFGGSFRQ